MTAHAYVCMCVCVSPAVGVRLAVARNAVYLQSCAQRHPTGEAFILCSTADETLAVVNALVRVILAVNTYNTCLYYC